MHKPRVFVTRVIPSVGLDRIRVTWSQLEGDPDSLHAIIAMLERRELLRPRVDARLRRLEPEIVVPGHGILAGAGALDAQRNYLEETWQRCADLRGQVTTLRSERDFVQERLKALGAS